MKAVFAQDFAFAEDGIRQKVFLAGQEYEVSVSCFDSAMQVGAIVTQEPEAVEQPKRGVRRRGSMNNG